MTYCTILAKNYLPKALALADSLNRHQPGSTLVVLVIDARTDADLPEVSGVPGVRMMSLADYPLPEREVLHLATIYDLVEFATAVKPLLLDQLLEESEQVAYLDPDTYLTSPMEELSPALSASEGGLVLTPHFFRPPGPDAELSENHLLTVGFYNLGFCAVDRRARDFLRWWWGHLREECLWEPLSGLFVDQKWVDIGAPLFHGEALRHYGYNVGVANLDERPIAEDVDGYYIATTGDRLRLFHFHAFDTSAPEELSTRLDRSTAHLRDGAVDRLCAEYAKDLIVHEESAPPAPPYVFWTDTRGRRISRQLRRAYRVESRAGASLPSPFVAAEAEAFEAWRRRAWRPMSRELVTDAVKSARLSMPEEYERIKNRLPGVAGKLRGRLSLRSGIWE